jgi:serine/threonine protein kinase
VKILDFGLARLIHDEVETTGDGLIGTPYYLAPEQINDEPIDGRTDVYAFGVGLYRLVNGRYPFQAQHPAALLYVILNEHDFQCADGVPAELHNLILGCLEKNPGERPQGFDDLAVKFEELEDDRVAIKPGGSPSYSNLSAAAKRNSHENPYLNRVMIKNPSDFCGRATEVRRIYSRLTAAHPQSVSVVGERRIGKSSLLNYIYHPTSRRRFMKNHENAIVAYMDFQSKLKFDVEKFIEFLFNMFTFECKNGHDYRNREKSPDELGEVINELDKEGKRVIILMDEFEAITRNERFDESFFSFLRSLANSFKVAYVTSSREDLQKMCHNKDISDSPFFNIFSNIPLGPFTREEAIELITLPSEREGVPLAAHVETILDMAGYFPLFLQIACANVFDHLDDNPTQEPDWQRIKQVFMEEADPYFRSVWERLDPPSRENLSRIAERRSTSKKYVNEKLLRRGYLVESEKGVDVFASTFKEFVIREGAEEIGKRGLIGRLWEKGRGRRS